MPLVTCPDCERQISDAAPSCVGCGRPISTVAPILHAVPGGAGVPTREGGAQPLPACNACGSDDVRPLPFIHSAGSATVHTETSTSGVGIAGGEIGIGTATSSTVGRQITDLARRATPPHRKPDPSSGPAAAGVAVLTLVVVGAVLGSFWIGVTAALVLGLLTFAAGASGHAETAAANRAEYEGAVRAWQRSVMCLRCGHITVPTAA